MSSASTDQNPHPAAPPNAPPADARPPAPRPRARLTPAERFWAITTALACLTLLVTAALLTPSPAGHGTHESMGLPACGVPATLGFPCFTCGMTTAFAHAVRARPLAAVHAQPFGALLALLAASTFWVGIYAGATASPIWHALGRALLARGVWIALALLLAAWVYKASVW